jgi:hypothetical protein
VNRPPEEEEFDRVLTAVLSLSADNTVAHGWAKRLVDQRSLPPTISNKRARKELNKLATLTRRLRQHIWVMSPLTKDKLRGDPWFLTFNELDPLISDAENALAALTGDRGGTTGRPRKRYAKEITLLAAACYQELTGRPVGRSVRRGKATGPFVRFLHEVFAALEIDANVDAAARAVAYGENSKK